MSATTAATETRSDGNTTNGNQQLAPLPAALTIAEQTVAIDERRFALAQRQARVYAESGLVPNEYKNNIGNVLIAQNMARRMGADTLMVMQNLYIVHGKPGWSAAFLVASFNSNGRFSAIKYRFQGEKHTPEWGCQAYCTEIATGEAIQGTWITWEMANAEGWVNKAGSKWKTMPEQMFRYRAATFLIRATAPEIGMGLLTKDELDDMSETNGNGIAEKTRAGLDALKSRLVDEPETAAEDPNTITVEAEPFEETPETEPINLVDQSIHERPEDEEPAADESIDPLESLRADVKSALDELPKNIQKNVIAGKTLIKDMGADDLNQMLIEIRKVQ